MPSGNPPAASHEEDDREPLLLMRTHEPDAERLTTSSDVEEAVDIDQQRQCRICLETEGSDFISPCNCRGSSMYVHRECLDQWRATKEGAAFSQCTTCKARYHMTVHPPSVRAKAARFGFLVARDTLAISALTQLCVGLYALAAYLMDLFAGGALKKSCGYQDGPKFYYHFGLFVFFFVAGVLGRQISRVQREQHTLVLLTLRRRPRHARSRSARIARASAPTVATDLSSPQPRVTQELSHSSPLDPSSVRSRQRDSSGTGEAREEGDPAAARLELVPREMNLLPERDIEAAVPSLTSPSSQETLSPVLESRELSQLDRDVSLLSPSGSLSPQSQAGSQLSRTSMSSRDRRVLLRFRHSVELTPQAIAKGCLVAFVVGFLAMGLIEFGVATERLDGYFVACLAVVSVPSGIFYVLRLLKVVWDSHQCVLTKRRMTEEYVVEDIAGSWQPLPDENVQDLQKLGLW